MKPLKLTLTAALFFSPFYAFAHGEEVLFPVLIQIASIMAFLIFLSVSKIESNTKLLLTSSYFLTLGFIVLLTWRLTYRQNRIVIDIALILGPAIMTLGNFLFLKFRKRDRTV